MGEESSMSLNENVASALCYVLTWLTGIIFYFLEKKNKTVRFHALQSILVFIPLTVLGWLFSWLGTPSVSWGYYGPHYNPGNSALVYLSYIIWLIMFILWLVLIIKAYQGEKLKLPVISDIAEKYS